MIGWVNWVRLGPDAYIRVDSNDYCADPNVICWFVDGLADLTRVDDA